MAISMAAFMAYSTAMSLAQGAAASDASKAGELKRLSALTDDEINTMFAEAPGAAPITDAQPPMVPGGPVPGTEAAPPALAIGDSILGGSTPSTPAKGIGRDLTVAPTQNATQTQPDVVTKTVVDSSDAAKNAAAILAKEEAARKAAGEAAKKGGGTGPAAVGQMLMGLAQIAASSQRPPLKGTAPFQGQAPGIASPFARQGGVRQQPGQGIRTMQDFFQGLV